MIKGMTYLLLCTALHIHHFLNIKSRRQYFPAQQPHIKIQKPQRAQRKQQRSVISECSMVDFPFFGSPQAIVGWGAGFMGGSADGGRMDGRISGYLPVGK